MAISRLIRMLLKPPCQGSKETNLGKQDEGSLGLVRMPFWLQGRHQFCVGHRSPTHLSVGGRGVGDALAKPFSQYRIPEKSACRVGISAMAGAAGRITSVAMAGCSSRRICLRGILIGGISSSCCIMFHSESQASLYSRAHAGTRVPGLTPLAWIHVGYLVPVPMPQS